MSGHSSLTGADLHEPKGVESASIDTIYVADGVGSGAWEKLTTDSVNTGSLLNVNKTYVHVWLDDVSTASSILVPFSYSGTVTKVTSVIAGAIATADSIITVTDNGGSSMGTLTIAFTGSAEGDVDTLTPTSNNTFTSGQRIKIATDGGSTNAIRISFILDITITG